MINSEHFAEEMRLMRATHTDMMKEMSEVCGSIRELVVKIDNADKRFDFHGDRLTKVEKRIRDIELENASNRPMLDIARQMYKMQWVTIIAATSAVGGPEILKMFGS